MAKTADSLSKAPRMGHGAIRGILSEIEMFRQLPSIHGH